MGDFNTSLPEILALTPRWLVVSKPAGWLTIPGREAGGREAGGRESGGRGDGRKGSSNAPAPILIDWARSQHAPVWVVHRLDRETSGIVLFARSAADHQTANGWFQSRKVKKIYLCLASGSPPLPVFKLQQPIEGSPSVTQVEIKERFSAGFLAQVIPRTGRRHQIRIHLSQAGYPIFGDSLYGGWASVSSSFNLNEIKISRVALHASSLELPTGERFFAPLPEDFQLWIDLFKKEYKRVSV